MELSIYINILWRYKWLILLTTTVATIIATIATAFIEPSYNASVMLRIATTTQGGGDWGDTVYATRLMNTYEEILLSRTTNNLLVRQFDMDNDPDISVTILSNTELFQVSVAYKDPLIATQAANYLAVELVNQSQIIREYRGNPASIVEEATIPSQPSSPNLRLNVILALVAGLISGGGLAFILNNLDDTLHSTTDIIKKVNAPILGRIPNTKQLAKQILSNGHTPEAEAFRHVRTNLRNLFPQEHYQILTVTSAEPNEGKSVFVANLAQALAQGQDNILIIDADLRQPVMHNIFQADNELGLVDVLLAKISPAEAIQRVTTYENGFIDILPCGSKTELPAEILGNGLLKPILEQLRSKYDRILIDTPASIPVTDSAVVAPHTDGLILIISRTKSQSASVDEAVSNIALTRTKLLGVIINRAERNSSYRYYYT